MVVVSFIAALLVQIPQDTTFICVDDKMVLPKQKIVSRSVVKKPVVKKGHHKSVPKAKEKKVVVKIACRGGKSTGDTTGLQKWLGGFEQNMPFEPFLTIEEDSTVSRLPVITPTGSKKWWLGLLAVPIGIVALNGQSEPNAPINEPPVTSTPEPVTLALLVPGLIGVGYFKKRKKKE